MYVLVNSKTKELKSIAYFDTGGRRFKSVHLNHSDDKLKPHTHEGYIHSENHTQSKLHRTENDSGDEPDMETQCRNS